MSEKQDIKANCTPTISVVMAVYNGEKFLRESVDSILAQSFGDFEFIIVNDGSTDRTGVILASYDDPRIHIIDVAENLGLTKCLNVGLGKARGKFIARQDADDVSKSERFAEQVGFMNENLEIGLVGTYVTFIDKHRRWLQEWRPATRDSEIRSRLLEGSAFAHGTILARRNILSQVGGYDSYFRYSQDYDLWLRLRHVTRMANLPRHLYELRRFGGAISSRYTDDQSAYSLLARALDQQPDRRSLLDSRRSPRETLRRLFPDFFCQHRRQIAEACWEKAAEALNCAEHGSAFRLMLKAYRVYPERWRVRWAVGILAQSLFSGDR